MIDVIKIEDDVFSVQFTGSELKIIEGVCKKSGLGSASLVCKLLNTCLRNDDRNIFLERKRNGLEGKNG